MWAVFSHHDRNPARAEPFRSRLAIEEVEPPMPPEEEDDEREVLVNVGEHDDVVMMAFGGLYMRVGISNYEFFDVTSDLPAGMIFVRDRSRHIYQRGLADLGP